MLVIMLDFVRTLLLGKEMTIFVSKANFAIFLSHKIFSLALTRPFFAWYHFFF